jgi:hypothetical protein
MKNVYVIGIGLAATIALAVVSLAGESASDGNESAPDPAAIERSRKTVQMLDNIYKQTIVLITDKYVHDEDDYPAGSAAVALFATISKSGSHAVRLIDATGEPYEPANVANDDFEREGVKQLKAGAEHYEQIVRTDGKDYLRAITPVPVVMQKCVMCHAHYADAKQGEPIGAISYTVPIE